MPPYSNYSLGKKGVNVDASPAHADPEELLLAQNAVRDSLGVDGGLKSRDGLVKFTADLSGSVLGGIAMPVFNYTDTRTLYIPQTDAGTNKWYSSSDLFTTSAAVSAIGAWRDPTAFYANAARRPACFFNGQLYYASNNYTPGTTSPNIRVYNGSDDRELCRILPATAKGIVSITASRGYMWVLVLESGTTDADFVGTVWRLDEDGHLTKIGASLTTGYVPTAIIYYNNKIYVAGSRLTTTNESIIWSIDPLSGTTTWTTDLAGAADDYYVGGFASFGGLLYAVTANGGAATKGKILQRSLAGTWSTVDSTTNNGGSYEDIIAYEGYLYASSRNYGAAASTCVIRRSADGSTWATVTNNANNPGFGVFTAIGLKLFCSHSTKFQYASASDGTTWTAVTAPGSSNLGAAIGVLLVTGAPTWQDPVGSTNTPTVNVTNVTSTSVDTGPFQQLPTRRIERYYFYDAAGTACNNGGAWTTTGTLSVQRTATGIFERFNGNATSGAGARTNTVAFYWDLKPKVEITFRTDALGTSIRYWVGVFSQAPAGTSGSVNQVDTDDDMANRKYIGFRYSTAIPDPGWVTAQADGVTQTIGGSALMAYAVSTIYRFTISWISATSSQLSIENLTLGTSATTTVTHADLTGIDLSVQAVYSIATTNRNLDLQSIWFSYDPHVTSL